MTESFQVERRRQYCLRCGQLMFEYYRSPDGHFGVAGPQGAEPGPAGTTGHEVRCAGCGAPYRLLDLLNAVGQPVERK